MDGSRANLAISIGGDMPSENSTRRTCGWSTWQEPAITARRTFGVHEPTRSRQPALAVTFNNLPTSDRTGVNT
jgi:hypothetical protein